MTTTDTTTTPRGRDLALRLASEQAQVMLAVARRYSLCADDAHDACQRAFEILLRRADSLDPAGATSWLRTVVKHEALAVRAARWRIVGPAEVDLDGAEARELTPADERAADGERMGRSAEALSRLKPQEVRALVLKARGYSYKEIAELTGWTYTKVNRCITEGRRAFLDRYAEIEAGRECDRWAPTLSALADGEASAQDVAALRPHLRHCPACRARLRDFRAAPRAVAAVAGPLVLAEAPGAGPGAPTEAAAGDFAPPDADQGGVGDADQGGIGFLARAWDAVAGGTHDRIVLSAHKLQTGIEVVSASKVAAVAASATALAGGGAAALRGNAAPAPRHPVRPAAMERPEPLTPTPRGTPAGATKRRPPAETGGERHPSLSPQARSRARTGSESPGTEPQRGASEFEPAPRGPASSSVVAAPRGIARSPRAGTRADAPQATEAAPDGPARSSARAAPTPPSTEFGP